MRIWKTEPAPQALGFNVKPNLMDALGITVDEVGDNFLRGSMPVDHRTRQSMGILHGGASVALAESLGSIAANFCVDATRSAAVGMQINANHLRRASGGRVTGTARPIHLGRTTQVWCIEIEDDTGKLICVSTLTMAVINRESVAA